mgnify:CR=1 FL=1
MRSILSDTPYPQALYNSVMLRVKADQDDKDKHIYKISDRKSRHHQGLFIERIFRKGEEVNCGIE